MDKKQEKYIYNKQFVFCRKKKQHLWYPNTSFTFFLKKRGSNCRSDSLPIGHPNSPASEIRSLPPRVQCPSWRMADIFVLPCTAAQQLGDTFSGQMRRVCEPGSLKILKCWNPAKIKKNVPNRIDGEDQQVLTKYNINSPFEGSGHSSWGSCELTLAYQCFWWKLSGRMIFNIGSATVTRYHEFESELKKVRK